MVTLDDPQDLRNYSNIELKHQHNHFPRPLEDNTLPPLDPSHEEIPVDEVRDASLPAPDSRPVSELPCLDANTLDGSFGANMSSDFREDALAAVVHSSPVPTHNNGEEDGGRP